ncbi:MAG: hypothetical protein HPY44_09700 [Armatimonadetes bacterium]|nr:hypothetical protein [Armatimonadota bacterium]
MPTPFAILVLFTCAVSSAAPLTTEVVSPRAGLTFTDSEPVDVRVRLTGLDAPVPVRYTVREAQGPWQVQGEVSVEPIRDGAGEARLPLELPGRGLYTVTVEARRGDEQARDEKSLGVVFPPHPVSETSHWGIFYIPRTWEGKSRSESYQDIARNIRMLGASWVRFNFWAHIFGKITITQGENPQASADWSDAKLMVKALRDEGLLILGEVAQCPRELSSRPDDTTPSGDAGPVYNRVKPADYALWEQLMEKLARDFAEEIPVWEIWNEANLPNAYWTGTVEEFAEHVKRTAAGLRRGNPGAKIAAAGFVGGHDFADKCFNLGMGQAIDILTVHYTDENPGWIDGWKALLAKHKLNLPIWNSEERSEVPVRNMAGGIEHSIKFCHINIGYEAFRLLVNLDLTPREPAIWFSVGTHCIGDSTWAGRDGSVPGYDVHFFQRGEERIAAFTRHDVAGKLFTIANEVTLSVTPLRPEEPVLVTDILGRSKPLEIQGGRGTLALSGPLFINGARAIEITRSSLGIAEDVMVFEAESAKKSAGFGVNNHTGFSEGRTLDIWSDVDPGPEGYYVELDLTVPAAGRYEVLFAGNGLGRLAAPRSLSPFVWQIDGGEQHLADKALPVTHGIPGAPEGLSTLGTVDLAPGAHTFRLKLTARRDTPDRHWALWFDAIALRRLPD